MAIRDNIRKKIVVSGGGSSGGGSGGGSGAVENSYTVNFKVDGEIVESHTAKVGNWIDAPMSYDLTWVNGSGDVMSFPLVGNEAETYTFLGEFRNLSPTLYTYYGLDASEYPYIFMYIRDVKTTCEVGIIFCNGYTLKEESFAEYPILYIASSKKCKYNKIATTSVNKDFTLTQLYDFIIANFSTLNTKASNTYLDVQNNADSGYYSYFYTNVTGNIPQILKGQFK